MRIGPRVSENTLSGMVEFTILQGTDYYKRQDSDVRALVPLC